MSRIRIQVLPEAIANRIAAGEIIERPASVVRELLDNAIDAGSKRIDITVLGGGRSMVTVKDNGCGIDHDSMLLAFERHATSKIKALSDLDEITTLGFRGEALPSIASVSKVVIESFSPEFDSGTRLSIEGGRIVGVESCACPPGTTVTVRDLFYNVPARRKFLRTQETEYGHILDTFIDHALTNPQVHFSFSKNEKLVFDAPAVDKWLPRLNILLGKSHTKNMLEVRGENQGISIHGFISSPEYLHQTARSQRLYINGRRIRDRIITQAVYRAYREFLTAQRHPVLVLMVQLDPSEVDVNVHPTKSEVRFRNPGAVFDSVMEAVKRALLTSLQKTFSTSGGDALPGQGHRPTIHPPHKQIRINRKRAIRCIRLCISGPDRS